MKPCVKKRFVPLNRKAGMNCKDRNLSKIVQGCSRETNCTVVYLVIYWFRIVIKCEWKKVWMCYGYT